MATKSVSINAEQKRTFLKELVDRTFEHKMLEMNNGRSAADIFIAHATHLQDGFLAGYKDAQDLCDLYTFKSKLVQPCFETRGNTLGLRDVRIGGEREGFFLFQTMSRTKKLDPMWQYADACNGSCHVADWVKPALQKVANVRVPRAMRDQWGQTNERSFDTRLGLKKYMSNRPPRVVLAKDCRFWVKPERNSGELVAAMKELVTDFLKYSAVWEEAAQFAIELEKMLAGVRNTSALQRRFPDLYEAWVEIIGDPNSTTAMVPVADVRHVNKLLREYKRNKAA